MPHITQYYEIPGPVPFVDVEVTADNRLYVDPHAIRLRGLPQPFADQAVQCMDTFAHQVLRCILTGTPESLRRGEELLQRFTEPSETRCGMAATGFRGHGGGPLVGTWIWNALTTKLEALVRVGLLKQIEDLPLFVDGVDRDITSDITTRLIFEPLARFTEHMIDVYPQFTAEGHQTQEYRRQVWNPVSRDWDEAEMTLPVVDGEPLLLIPEGWARKNLLMSAKRYYETSALSFVQSRQAVRGSDGKLIKTPKDRLKKQPGLERGRATNVHITMQAFEDDDDLLAIFKAFVASRFDQNDSVPSSHD